MSGVTMQRSWEFLVGLVLLELYPQTLTLVAAFGLVDGLALVVFGGAVGEYVDRCAPLRQVAMTVWFQVSVCDGRESPQRRRSERLRSACSMYALQNFSLAVSASALLAASLVSRSGGLFWACSAMAIACGAASSLFALGSSLAVEREWPRTLCGADSAALARLNAGAAQKCLPQYFALFRCRPKDN